MATKDACYSKVKARYNKSAKRARGGILRKKVKVF